MLEHGGRLRLAAKQYGIALSQWLDLSTGLNPHAWPVPDVPSSVWARLPEDEDGLRAAARAYYGVHQLLPVAGSQAAIQALPRLWWQLRGRPAHIGMLSLSYAEHAHCWQQQGHSVQPLSPETIEPCLSQLDCLLLVNPNNPDGRAFAADQLLAWRAQLPEDGWLLVDEAFLDAGLLPGTDGGNLSLAPYSEQQGIVVLRSLGKFFGLAGARVGFVLAATQLLRPLQELLGPWCLSGPSRYIAERALRDVGWHTQAQTRLQEQGRRLQCLLQQFGFCPIGRSVLFQSLQGDFVYDLHRFLAQHGVLSRYFEHWQGLRFGLPGSERQWQLLQKILQEFTGGALHQAQVARS